MAKKKTRAQVLRARIAKIEGVAQEAQEARSFSACVAAQAKVASMEAELSRLEELEAVQDADDPLVELGVKRRIAEREGSWVAAAKMADTEANLRAKLEEARAREEEAKYEHLSETELMETVLDLVATLPVAELVAIHAAISGRLGDTATTGPDAEA